MFQGFLAVFLASLFSVAASALILFWLSKRRSGALFLKHLIGWLILATRARFSILTGIPLLLLPIAAAVWPKMVRGVFILRGWAQMGFVTWSTLMVALMVFVTFRVNCRTAPERFGPVSGAIIPKPGGFLLRKDWSWLAWCMWLILGLTVPSYCLCATSREAIATPSNGPCIIDLLIGMSLGTSAAMLTILAMVVLQRLVFSKALWMSGLLPFESLKLLDKLPNFFQTFGPFWGNLVVRILGPSVYEPVPGQAPPPYVSNGYFKLTNPTDLASWELEPGHAQVGMMWGSITFLHLLFYAVGSILIWSGSMDIPSQDGVLTALFFVMVILFFIGFTLTGVSFFLDYYRVPTLVPVILVLLGSYQIWKVDHVYDLNPPRDRGSIWNLTWRAPMPEPGQDQIELRTVFGVEIPRNKRHSDEKRIQSWVFPSYRRQRTLVVVTAAGGGIQASAWTTRVLTGLDKRFKGLSESVGMISSVSGGTVGSPFYLLYRGERQNTGTNSMRIDEEVRDSIHQDSMVSGLESAFWGFAFPDLIRITFPPAVPRDLDRGWALEMEWQRRMLLYLKRIQAKTAQKESWQDFRLLDWTAPIRDGKMPIPIFNSTILETGQRMMISPVTALDPSQVYSDDPLNGVEFFSCYSLGTFRPNPRLITAARLSATFSYISPVCRPKAIDFPSEFLEDIDPKHLESFKKRLHWHLADGGYSDNEGIITATKWIRELLDSYRNDPNPNARPPFDRVLLIRINGFPDQVSTPEDKAKGRRPSQGSVNGFGDAVLGPVLTLSSVRVATQAERGDYEMRLLEQATQANRKFENFAYVKSKFGVDLSAVPDQITTLPSRLKSAVQLSPPQVALQSFNFARDSVKYLIQQRAEGNSTNTDRSNLPESRFPREIQVRSIKFQYPKNLPYPPLSWSLTPTEKQLIEDAWKQIEKELDEPIDEYILPLELKPRHLKAFFPTWDDGDVENE